ncbi:MAG: LamG domain-containing protein [Mariniphaga sp.]|nr:LamG domain-containing protein [Mariniphaga sp.]
MNLKRFRLLVLIAASIYLSLKTEAQTYHWQNPNSKVIATGDLTWQPEPFEYPVSRGEEIRYIDYESGDDQNSGLTKDVPWKHHPWDTRASGNAARESGIRSYVFKRGVTYRLYPEDGEVVLQADDSGVENKPIRLTSDPNWGVGEAVIAGSRLIDTPWRKATRNDVPKRMNPENIWFIDINMPAAPQKELPPSVRENFMEWRFGGPRMAEMILFEVTPQGDIQDLHIASDVGWNITNPNFVMHHWNQWDGEMNISPEGEKEDLHGYDDALVGFDSDYFDGGTLWSQYGGLMGTPTPSVLEPGDYDPVKGILAHRNQGHPTFKGVRYLIENLPQFLDKPGEYYFDRDFHGNRGRLFLRLPADRDPNQSRIELSTAWNSIVIHNQSHIEISGLSFRFNGRKGAVIDLANGSSHITVKNCTFEHLSNDGIYGRVRANEWMDDIRITDCDFYHVNGGTVICLQGHGGGLKNEERLGVMDHIQVLRNRTRNAGLYRHNDSPWSNVPAIAVNYARIGEVAGNMADMSFGSGIVVQGGKNGTDNQAYDIPLIRIFVHHNKIEHTALGLNDYGGLSLWQHGPLYSYSNIVGNAVGHWPGGFGGRRTINLSYPIYLDAGFRVFNFNNISWARPFKEDDPYTSTSSAYFNVFGYLNPFVNNTVYGSGVALGGTSGNRNDYVGNIFTHITRDFISVNHGGNPSLIGGDDPGTSGIDGATTLAYGSNLFYGPARAGTVATIRQGAKKDLNSDDLQVLKKQMQEYPLRFAEVGNQTSRQPLEKPLPDEVKPGISDADFRPASGSDAVNNGIQYFVPWSLYGTIGEWHFNENHSNPELVLDYHHYPTLEYFNRSMYYKVPVFELEVNQAGLDDFIPSASESWAKGAMVFDGSRYAKLTDAKMKADVLIHINDLGRRVALPNDPWIAPEPASVSEDGRPQYADDQYFRFPGEKRKNPDMKINNFLLEVILKVDKNYRNGGVMGKHDGETGYKLFLNKKGRMEFVVSVHGIHEALTGKKKINDGNWHHVIAEIDRQNNEMIIYIDGKQVGKQKTSIPASASLSNKADFLVARDNAGKNYLKGAIDFVRVSLGTLADSETSIDEIYEWQTNGPVKYDFAGNKPQGKRDIGALERVE